MKKIQTTRKDYAKWFKKVVGKSIGKLLEEGKTLKEIKKIAQEHNINFPGKYLNSYRKWFLNNRKKSDGGDIKLVDNNSDDVNMGCNSNNSGDDISNSSENDIGVSRNTKKKSRDMEGKISKEDINKVLVKVIRYGEKLLDEGNIPITTSDLIKVIELFMKLNEEFSDIQRQIEAILSNDSQQDTR